MPLTVEEFEKVDRAKRERIKNAVITAVQEKRGGDTSLDYLEEVNGDDLQELIRRVYDIAMMKQNEFFATLGENAKNFTAQVKGTAVTPSTSVKKMQGRFKAWMRSIFIQAEPPVAPPNLSDEEDASEDDFGEFVDEEDEEHEFEDDEEVIEVLPVAQNQNLRRAAKELLDKMSDDDLNSIIPLLTRISIKQEPNA
eukprot:TRINITY_DN10346_c0_g1_i1.p1 TRINITY_DN10346_c0_g1~~TRINITY_DN10346_c0_g1_i1.p1  ORF type:complete len:196 (-),score=72.21 TRINITY_DN10346_c0_g1_i1:34-621(-)